jgi:polysaccharide biosynthesis transport protein
MPDANLKPPAIPLAAHEKDDEVVERRTLRDYYVILRERLWIALPLALIVSLGYGYLRMREAPLYQSSGTLQFEKPDTVVRNNQVIDIAPYGDYDINTYIQMLNSRRLRSRVLESFNAKPEEKAILQRAALKKEPPGTPASAISPDKMLGSVTPEPIRSSFLISIKVTHEDPEAAELVANRYLHEFMQEITDKAKGAQNSASGYYATQSERQKKLAEDADRKMQEFVREKKTLSLTGSIDIVNDTLKRVSAALNDAKLKLLAVEDQYRQVQTFKSDGRNLLEISSIAAHGALPGLKAQLIALQQRRLLLADRYLELHPEMIKVSNEIASTEEQIEKAKALAIADLETQLAEARQAVQTYTAERETREKESLILGDYNVEYTSLKREAEAAANLYKIMLESLAKILSMTETEKIPIHPLDKAVANYLPISPNKPAITKTCIGIGVIVFIAVAVGLSFIDDRIKSAWDVEAFIGANLLGIIPDLTSMKDDEKYTLLMDNKQVPGVEAFLGVYSSIKIHSKLDFPKTILVTSTIPGEGKTLISCNIAGSFARHGRRTLLIDCDLRRPMLHRHFKQQNTNGLIPWFEAGASLDGEMATNAALGIAKIGENLSLLCSGGRSKIPTELLENAIFGQLLERLKREYDLVIVDSPPLGAVTDSLLIAERVDEVIYVCRFNRAYRKHIRLYMRALRNGKNEILGVVLNGLSPRRIEYYSNYRYYRSYKKYYGAQT